LLEVGSQQGSILDLGRRDRVSLQLFRADAVARQRLNRGDARSSERNRESDARDNHRRRRPNRAKSFMVLLDRGEA
jgi:hypothetical protein